VPTHNHHLQYTCSHTDGSDLPINFSRLTPFYLKKLNITFWSYLDSSTSWYIVFKLHCTVVHPVPCIVLYKCLPVCLPSQNCSCTIYISRAAPQIGFSCMGPINIHTSNTATWSTHSQKKMMSHLLPIFTFNYTIQTNLAEKITWDVLLLHFQNSPQKEWHSYQTIGLKN
jgi:hypothetical protein